MKKRPEQMAKEAEGVNDSSRPTSGDEKKSEGRDEGQRVPRLGVGDVQTLPGLEEPASPEEQGMLMGPGHPIFRQPAPGEADSEGRGGRRPEFPPGVRPPGARFDPISPLDPEGTGEPDFDEFLPPGNEQPPTKRRSDKPFTPFMRRPGGDPFSGGGAPFFK
jgi:hypothetical protein